jgi:Tol biopolymer transport system component
VKVLDFGLAKALTSEAPSDMSPISSPTLTMRATMAGVILGTAAYMSPEQARGQNVDRRADIWAFSVVLYEMLAGRPLFAGPTVSDTLAAVLRADPDWSALPPDMPEPIRRLLRRCLARDSKKRLADIGDARLEIDEALAGPAQPRPAPRSKVAPWPWVAVATICAIAAILVFLMRFRETPPRRDIVRFSIPAPENTTGFDLAAISPDGRRIAFVARPRAAADTLLYVRFLDSLTPRTLQGTERAGGPFWSPDGQFLAFRSADGKLKKVDVTGGAPQELCDSDSSGPGAWNSSGVILFQRVADGGLYRVPAAGGTPILVSKPDPSRKETRHIDPQFLPDGRHYLFVAGSEQPGASTLYAAALESPQRTAIMPIESNVMFAPAEGGRRTGHLLFVRGGALMAQPFDAEQLRTTGEAFPVGENIGTISTFTSATVIRSYRFGVSANGETLIQWGVAEPKEQLTWFDRSGRKLEAVGPVSRMAGLAVAPDGVHIAVGMGEEFAECQLWLLDGTRGTSSRLTFQGGPNVRPRFSPDGSQVVFLSNRANGSGIYRKAANGTGTEERLLPTTGAVYATDWSPDGRFLAYVVSDPQSKFDIWILPLEGDRKPYPLLHTKANENYPQFSPDGKWIAYQSDESGQPQVYVQPFPPGAGNSGKWQISVDGGWGARWRRDGKELIYLSGSKLVAVDINAAGGGFRAGIPKMLFDTVLTAPFAWYNYAPSADGRRFLMAAPVEHEAALPLTVVLNWQAGLKKVTLQTTIAR